MSFEPQLFAAIKGIFADRVFPDVAPADTPLPFATYQEIGGAPVNFTDATVPDRTNARVQITVWAASRLAASTAAAQVEAAVRAMALQPTVLTGRQALYDEESKTRGSMQDFSLWY